MLPQASVLNRMGRICSISNISATFCPNSYISLQKYERRMLLVHGEKLYHDAISAYHPNWTSKLNPNMSGDVDTANEGYRL
jgi:hypothetical protein